jgi:hypothetical protein
MIWLLQRMPYDDPRVFRLFACWCVRNTPIGGGRTVWDLLTDERSRNAVVVAERFADGKATRNDLEAAHQAAGDAYAQSPHAGKDPRALAARAAMGVAKADEASDNARLAAETASKGAARDAATAAQADQFRKMIPYSVASRWIKSHKGSSEAS